MYKTLLTNLDAGIFTITINRPDKLNALNKMVMEELSTAIEEVYEKPEIKSGVITGSGQKSFVAGADISEFIGLSKGEGMDLAKRGQDIFFMIEESAKPIVAAVNGFALGGGCELAMACHFRVAAENAIFGQPEVNLGLVPGYGGTQRMVHLIGKGRAVELLISGTLINAQLALQYGLVNYVVPQAELLNKTRSLLEVINSKAPIAVAKCIHCANIATQTVAEGGGIRNGFVEELNSFEDCFGTDDMKEGTAAFLEKRKPVFKGK
jgi:enoyl-CoA hydratase